MPQGPGEVSFLESRDENEGDGQGQAHCAKHIGNSSKRDRTEGWRQAQLAYLGLYTWRALEAFCPCATWHMEEAWCLSKHIYVEMGCPRVTCSTLISSKSPSLPKLLAENAEKRRFEE